MKNKKLILTLAVSAWVCAVSCQPDMKLQYASGEGIEKDKMLPEVPEGARTGFSISTEEGALRSVIGTGAHVFSEKDKIYLRSVLYSPVVAEDGSVSLDVSEFASGNYQMFCYPEGSRYWFRSGGDNPLSDLVIPFSQFYRRTVDSLAFYPLYGSFSGNGGGKIEFREVISAVGITLKGSSKIASVHLQNKATSHLLTDNLAGVASFDLTSGGYTLTEGVNFINLNCTDEGKGVEITPDGKTFYLVLAPGSYKAGFTLSVTGMDHKGQTFDVPGFDISAGEVKTIGPFEYKPDADLLFFERFDNFVWGGNVKGNPSVSSYAPDGLATPESNRTGSEEAFTTVGTSTPGSAVIQKEGWDSITGWTVADRNNNLSMDYVRSRNIGDYAYLYLCQEYQGCVSVGAGDNLRGVFQPIKQFNFNDIYFGLKLSFDICLRYGTGDDFCTTLNGNGIATKLVIDGKEITLEDSLEGNNTYSYTFQNICSLLRRDIPAPTSGSYENGWHHVEMTFENLNELSELSLRGLNDESSVKHGSFIDNVELRYCPMEHPANSLKVLLYNIQNGMWADQTNNFEKFVAFVRKYDPDVCVICEAQSMWDDNGQDYPDYTGRLFRLFTDKEGQNSSAATLENDQWKALAARYGHSYHAVGGYHDDYPQVITSKYPITTVARLNNGKDRKGSPTNISHGAGHFQITAGDQTINFVSLHLWPQKYAPKYWNYPANSQERINSIANLEGYDFQAREVEAILNATVKRTDCGNNWLIMGDTNSVSPIDGDYYESESGHYDRWDSEGEKWVLAHERFRDGESGRKLYDMLREGAGSHYCGTGRFMTTTGAQARMDIMYGSESMRKRVSGMSLVVCDKWSDIITSAIYRKSDEKYIKVPSDHRPLLIEFDMSK